MSVNIDFEREIFRLEGEAEGPTVVFFAGLHGNEPSGVYALRKVYKHLVENKIAIRGRVIALAGNLWALQRGKRFDQMDLNRLWTHQNIQLLKEGKFVPQNEDEQQQLELFQLLNQILSSKNTPFYFIDLHTTSGPTIPFLTVNDSLLNRKFIAPYPVPKILGIEEYLDGPLLNYINEMGHVSFGFEGGQHDDPQAVLNHESFVWLSLVFAESIEKEDVDFAAHFQNLEQKITNDFEIFYRHEIQQNEQFKMLPGFTNFQTVTKGQQLAISDGQEVIAPSTGEIFMPLYQAQGNDGFFLVRPIPKVFLQLSAFLRNNNFHHWLRYLPGIKTHPQRKEALLVNKRVARFLTKPILHLLGFRSSKYQEPYLEIWHREVAEVKKNYTSAKWYSRRNRSK